MEREPINSSTIWNGTTDDWWFSIPEIAKLLDTTYPVVKRHLKKLVQNGILKEHLVCKCVRLGNGNSMDVYHMEVVLALSFCVASAASHEFRKKCSNGLHIRTHSGSSLLSSQFPVGAVVEK